MTMDKPITIKLPLEHLRWLIDQLETSFEEGQLSEMQEEAMKILRDAVPRRKPNAHQR